MSRLSKDIATACEGLVMIHSASSRPAISFPDKCKYVLTETLHIVGQVVHSINKNYIIIKVIIKETI